jgi:hypothetical protein
MQMMCSDALSCSIHVSVYENTDLTSQHFGDVPESISCIAILYLRRLFGQHGTLLQGLR